MLTPMSSLCRMDLPNLLLGEAPFFFSSLNPPDDWIYLPTSGLAYPHVFFNKGKVRFVMRKFALEVIIQVARSLGTKYLVDTNKIFSQKVCRLHSLTLTSSQLIIIPSVNGIDSDEPSTRKILVDKRDFEGIDWRR